MRLTLILASGAAALALIVLAGAMWITAEREAAVEAERRERMSDAIELIRETDKNLGVARKATNADLCRELGGKTVDGVCQ